MRARHGLFLGALLLLAGLVIVGLRELLPSYASYAGNIQPLRIIPSLTGGPEYCLTCHQGVEEISSAHPVEVFGCVTCHGGEPLSLDPDKAHQGLIGGRNPSDFAVVEQACGGSDCHSGSPENQRDHIARALTSIQSTYAGAIAQVRFAFGAQPDQVAYYGIQAARDVEVITDTGLLKLEAFDPVLLQDPEPVQSFAERCLTCHLYAEPILEMGYHRLTGCSACHSPSNLTGTYVGEDPTIAREESGHAAQHRLTIAIAYTQCNACHNRGNYNLVDMAFRPREDLPEGRSAPRLDEYYQPIAQFSLCEWELDCVDCHTRMEGMGDGDLHSNKSEIQYVQCKTCHGTLEQPPLTSIISDPNDLAFRLAFLNPVIELQAGDTILVTEKGEPLWNVVRGEDGGFILVGKETGIAYDLPLVVGSDCEQKLDEQESRYCHACHAVERP
ncbi:MAG: hypothetical protein A2Z14_15600 [Chloroflexi bacterium RBG_16_48_8]|nr:MAG: hypothetical protein A2Z14_15600 [Chloroflexi bacterium RBG_16_48_8]